MRLQGLRFLGGVFFWCGIVTTLCLFLPQHVEAAINFSSSGLQTWKEDEIKNITVTYTSTASGLTFPRYIKGVFYKNQEQTKTFGCTSGTGVENSFTCIEGQTSNLSFPQIEKQSDLGIPLTISFKPDPEDGDYSGPSTTYSFQIHICSESINDCEKSEAIPVQITAMPVTKISLSEFYACPVNGAMEWVELYNDEDRAQTLRNWNIKDEKTSAHVIEMLTIPPKGYASVEIKSGLLNNTGDTVKLMGSDGTQVDSYQYATCHTEKSWAKISGSWKETTIITREAANSSAATPTPAPQASSQSTPTPTATVSPSPVSTPTQSPQASANPGATISTDSNSTESGTATRSGVVLGAVANLFAAGGLSDQEDEMKESLGDTSVENQEKSTLPVAIGFGVGTITLLGAGIYLFHQGYVGSKKKRRP